MLTWNFSIVGEWVLAKVTTRSRSVGCFSGARKAILGRCNTDGISTSVPKRVADDDGPS
jgi:hypothetical protein